MIYYSAYHKLQLQNELLKEIQSDIIFNTDWISVRKSTHETSVVDLLSKDEDELHMINSAVNFCKIIQTKSSLFLLPKFKSTKSYAFLEDNYPTPIHIILDKGEKLNFTSKVQDCKCFSMIYIGKTKVNSYATIRFTRGKKTVINSMEFVFEKDINLPQVCVQNF